MFDFANMLLTKTCEETAGASDAFCVSFGGNQIDNLQESFLHYRRARLEEIKQARKMVEKNSKPTNSDPACMDALRVKFLEAAKKYIGVPYAQKYWSAEEPEYSSPLFLDCCGHVRRILRDLEQEFGFKIGPWNQAYQFDTLPITVSSADEMKPGDLVFISGTYTNQKSKKQRHNIVHVEIWYGEGEKTLGARWQRGKVQIHDSYKFEARSFHSPTYIFKSIDTWLMGICKSYCDAHLWTASRYEPGVKSIFYDAEDDRGMDDDEDAGDTDDELIKTCDTFDVQLHQSIDMQCSLEDRENIPCDVSCQKKTDSPSAYDEPCETVGQGDKSSSSQSTTHQASSDKISGGFRSSGGGGGNDNGNSGGGKKRSSENNDGASSNSSKSKVMSTSAQAPTFQIAGGNAAPLIDAYLTSIGWKRIKDKNNFNWKLKWVESNGSINYGAFRDGEQLVNRIPNCSLLTNKLGLYNSLSEYNRVVVALKGERVKLKLEDFVPETYRIDQHKDREAFLGKYVDGEIWICKPVGLNQGKGIFLIRSRAEIDGLLAEREQKSQSRRTRPPMSMVMQRYITKPLLVDEKKFDIRAYMLIASTIPYLVLYHHGYVRVTCDRYDPDSTDLTTHLTNQFVQKKREDYKDIKEDTVWSMAKLNSYVNDNCRASKGIEEDWILIHFEKQIKAIMKYCFNSVKHKLQCRLGLFDLYGFDFMIDDNFKVWLIEVNVNPAMHVNCDVLKETLPPILEETLDLAVECFEKSKRNQPLLPLQSLRSFHVLHNGCPKSSAQNPSSTSADAPVVSSPPRPRRSTSPTKESSWGYISRAPVKNSRSQSVLIPATEQELVAGVPLKTSLNASNSNNNNSSAPQQAERGNQTERAELLASARPRYPLAGDTHQDRSPEDIVQEIKEFRPKTPYLPPLYTIRSDVAPLRVLPVVSSDNLLAAGIVEPPSSTLRLSLVHMAYAPGQAKTRKSGANQPKDRAS